MSLSRPLLAALCASALLSTAASAGSFSYSHSDDGRFSYGYIEPGGSGSIQILSGETPSAVDELQAEAREPLLWFRRDGREYIIRDEEFVARGRTALKPVMDLGREQGRIGGIQGKLGAKQGAIGARMGALGARLGALATRQAIAGLQGEDADDNFAHERASIERKMRALEREQRPLARQQQELGAKQAELGRRQKVASQRAESRMRTILEDAIRAGEAEKVSIRVRPS